MGAPTGSCDPSPTLLFAGAHLPLTLHRGDTREDPP
jgi:hypothetical protein